MRFSEAFLSQAAVERDQLVRIVSDAESQVTRLRKALAEAETTLSLQRSALIEVEEILGVSSQLPLEGQGLRLGGRELRDKAFEVLVSSEVTGPIHYTQWFGLLVAQGYGVRGQNPLATFLTQISRDDRVKSVGAKSGKYELATRSPFVAVA